MEPTVKVARFNGSPITSVARSGDCRYVYLREECNFAGIKDAETLLDRLMKCNTGLVTGINRFVPESMTRLKTWNT